MKSRIKFFFVPTEFLARDPDLENQPFLDLLVSFEFHHTVREIAEKYNIDYLTARGILIEIYRSQTTFGLYGICCAVFKGRGWAASQFFLKCGQTVELCRLP